MHTFSVNKEFWLLSLDSQSRVFSKLYLQYIVPRMILGLIDKSTRGSRCIAMRVCSRVKEGFRSLTWWVCLPRCVEMSM